METRAAECRRIIARHSKSFALASRLLAPAVRDQAVALYAWCRRCDDAVDLAPPADQPAALARLRLELDRLCAGEPQADIVLAAFQETMAERRLPREYADELLAGMAMDVAGERYADFPALLHYCHRVAGVVGLMMCHVLGVADDDALPQAAALGVAMQLTNIARDVQEDWRNGRLYLPADALPPEFAVDRDLRRLAPAIWELLDRADRYYALGDAGLRALPWRSAASIRTARRVYAAIGDRVRAAGCDPTRGRAIVPGPRKLALAAGAVCAGLGEGLSRLTAIQRFAPPTRVLHFDELPVL